MKWVTRYPAGILRDTFRHNRQQEGKGQAHLKKQVNFGHLRVVE